MTKHNRYGELVQIPCLHCDTRLEARWSYESVKRESDGTVLFASAWCPRCLEYAEVCDVETEHKKWHREFAAEACSSLEAIGRWLFSDEDRNQLSKAPFMVGSQEAEIAFLHSVARMHPKQLLCIHTGIKEHSTYYGGVEPDTVTAQESTAIAYTCATYLFVPGKPAPAFVPLVEVEAGRGPTELARREAEAVHRYQEEVKRGRHPEYIPCRNDLTEGFALVETNEFGRLDEAGVESGIRDYFRYAVPLLADLPIELVDLSQGISDS